MKTASEVFLFLLLIICIFSSCGKNVRQGERAVSEHSNEVPSSPDSVSTSSDITSEETQSIFDEDYEFMTPTVLSVEDFSAIRLKTLDTVPDFYLHYNSMTRNPYSDNQFAYVVDKGKEVNNHEDVNNLEYNYQVFYQLIVQTGENYLVLKEDWIELGEYRMPSILWLNENELLFNNNEIYDTLSGEIVETIDWYDYRSAKSLAAGTQIEEPVDLFPSQRDESLFYDMLYADFYIKSVKYNGIDTIAIIVAQRGDFFIIGLYHREEEKVDYLIGSAKIWATNCLELNWKDTEVLEYVFFSDESVKNDDSQFGLRINQYNIRNDRVQEVAYVETFGDPPYPPIYTLDSYGLSIQDAFYYRMNSWQEVHLKFTVSNCFGSDIFVFQQHKDGENSFLFLNTDTGSTYFLEDRILIDETIETDPLISDIYYLGECSFFSKSQKKIYFVSFEK